MTKPLRVPVYEVQRSNEWIAFRFEDAAFGPLLDQMESRRKWGGVAWMLTIAKPQKPRTTGKNSQNTKFNGGVQVLCDELGWDFADMKLYLKRRAMRRGLPAMTDADGNIMYSRVDGEPLPMSEADMNTEQCGWCIEELEQTAAEEGVVLPCDDELTA